MKEKIRIYEKFAYSFYNFSAYRNFLTQGLFKAILYIFAVTLVFTTLSNIQIVRNFNDDFTRIENQFYKYSPDFELKDSKLNVNSETPIEYSYKGNSLLLSLVLGDHIIIDTTNKTDVSALSKYDSGMYINQDGITLKQYNPILTEPLTQSINFSDFAQVGLTLDKDTFSRELSMFKRLVDISILFVSPFFSFLQNIISVFIFIGPMAMLIARNFRLKLSYSQACSLGLYSMTLPIFLQSVVTIADYSVPSFSALFYLLTLCYCTLAINTFVHMHKRKINNLV